MARTPVQPVPSHTSSPSGVKDWTLAPFSLSGAMSGGVRTAIVPASRARSGVEAVTHS
jgi:hypothetical protein